MFVRQLHLGLRRHHAKAFNPTDFANANGDIKARHVNARFGHNHCDPLTGIRRTTDDLLHALIGVYLTDAQAIRVWVLFCTHDLTDCKIGQLRTAILNTFHFKTKVGQSV